MYSTKDTIKPLTITKATQSYKNCKFHKINGLRLQTDKFKLPYDYSEKFDKITITMPVENKTVYDSIQMEVIRALHKLDIDPQNLQLIKNGKIYLVINDRTAFFEKDKTPIKHDDGIDMLLRGTEIRCILTFKSICEYNGGCSYKINVDQVQVLESSFNNCDFDTINLWED